MATGAIRENTIRKMLPYSQSAHSTRSRILHTMHSLVAAVVYSLQRYESYVKTSIRRGKRDGTTFCCWCVRHVRQECGRGVCVFNEYQYVEICGQDNIMDGFGFSLHELILMSVCR